MKLQARNFVVRKPETIDITMFFKKFCIATRTIKRLQNRCSRRKSRFYRGFLHLYGKISANRFDRYKNDVFSLLDVLNYHATEYPICRQTEIKK